MSPTTAGLGGQPRVYSSQICAGDRAGPGRGLCSSRWGCRRPSTQLWAGPGVQAASDEQSIPVIHNFLFFKPPKSSRSPRFTPFCSLSPSEHGRRAPSHGSRKVEVTCLPDSQKTSSTSCFRCPLVPRLRRVLGPPLSHDSTLSASVASSRYVSGYQRGLVHRPAHFPPFSSVYHGADSSVRSPPTAPSPRLSEAHGTRGLAP